MIDSYKDIQDVLSVAGYTQNGLESIDHRGVETRPLQQGRCYLFDGNDFVVTGNDPSFETATTQMTGVCDLELTSAGGTFYNKDRATGGWDSYMLRYWTPNNIQIAFTNGSLSPASNQCFVPAGTEIKSPFSHKTLKTSPFSK